MVRAQYKKSKGGHLNRRLDMHMHTHVVHCTLIGIIMRISHCASRVFARSLDGSKSGLM